MRDNFSPLEMAIEKLVLNIKNLEEISLVWGLFDIILKIEADSASALDKLVTEEIRTYSNISSTMTMLIRED